MKNLLVVLALMVSTISLGQKLNDNATNLKAKNIKEFNKVELLVQQDYRKSDPIYTLMINAQIDARRKVAVFMGRDLTSADYKKLGRYMDMSSEFINGVEIFNWVLLSNFVSRM